MGLGLGGGCVVDGGSMGGGGGDGVDGWVEFLCWVFWVFTMVMEMTSGCERGEERQKLERDKNIFYYVDILF